MERPKSGVMAGSITLLLILAAAVTFAVRARRSDAEVAQRILAGLANGKASVERAIAWERLQALRVDVGATYTGLPDDQERGRYRQMFIQSFAAGFQQTGARPEAFVNWRIQERGRGYTMVAADYPAKRSTLLLRLAKDGGRKLEGIQWK